MTDPGTAAGTSKNVTIIGLGAIGGSVARALVEKSILPTGFSDDPDDLWQARAHGVMAAETIEEAVAFASVVLIAVPLSALRDVADTVIDACAPAATILHAGSLQREDALRLGVAASRRVIGTHPYAGTHLSGYGASNADLFKGATVYMEARANDYDRADAEWLWKTVGAGRVLHMSAFEHDTLMGRMSHAPQLVATAIAAAMAKAKVDPHRVGPGLRDTTRLAMSALSMWEPMLAATPASTMEMLRRVENEIADLRDALVRVDTNRVRETWTVAQSRRSTVEHTIHNPEPIVAAPKPRRVTVSGDIQVPGDKSISHRALMLAAIGNGVSRVTGILQSDDVRSTANALRALGADIPELSDDMEIHGVGRHGLREPGIELDCGNSGTTTRLLAGIVAGAGLTATFVGDESLSRRPMRRIATPLEQMGARVDLPENGGLPMTVYGGPLTSMEWMSDVASAQVKSAILLAAVMSGMPVSVTEPSRSRDHTERMLAARGADLVIEDTLVRFNGINELMALDTDVPGDPSSAAFMGAFAAIADGGHVRLTNVCVNETRTGFFQAIHLMGGHMHYLDERESGGERIATIVVLAGELSGIEVGGDDIVTMIDELPLLACMSTRAFGETRITGAMELRGKESDRITAVVNNLKAIGADAEELPDGMVIRGNRKKTLAGNVTTHGDHRLAMAFGVLAAIPGNEIEIDDRECVAVSYPNFWDDLESLSRQ